MEASYSAVNIVSFVLIGIGLLVVVSVITLGAYFFGGRSPLERNARGRIEAALKPEDVLTAHRQYSRFRLVFMVAVLFGLYAVLQRTAPVQTEQAIDSFLAALSITLNRVIAVAAALRRGAKLRNAKCILILHAAD